MAIPFLKNWMQGQKLREPTMEDAPIFYRNLERAIDVRRRDLAQFVLRTNICRDGGEGIDFISNDTLALGASGQLRKETLRELDRHPDLAPGSGSTRMVDGNYHYLEMVEEEIANFHKAEAGVIVGSGFTANMSVFTAIPRPGDVIVYDERVHASTHEGMVRSEAVEKISFQHNDPDSLRETLISLSDSHPLVQQGKRCVLIAVESFYSFDGDVCPLQELVEVAKEIFPGGNAQFVVDEAHSTGVIGPNGSGLVCELGLEKEIAIRVHTYGKALASGGAIILGNATIKNALLNYAHIIIYSTAPGPLQVASIRSAYNLLRQESTLAARQNIQHLVKHFFKEIASNPVWEKAADRGILDVPLAYDWDTRPFVTQIVSISLRPRHAYWLSFHLTLAKICVLPLEPPIVAPGKSRIRIAFHANNTVSEVGALVSSVAEWSQEMLDLEGKEAIDDSIPKAAKEVYALMARTKGAELAVY